MENTDPNAWLAEVGLAVVSSDELDEMELRFNVGLVDDYEEMANADQSYMAKVEGRDEVGTIESFWDLLTSNRWVPSKPMASA
jgi:hypothetical protein